MSILLVLTILCIFIHSTQSKALQEGAKVSYYDPKYVKDAQAFTGRLKRGEPYRTNMSATIFQPWGNNVTFTVYYASKRTGNDRILELKLCETFSQPWLADFMWTYFQMKKRCPFPAGNYAVNNLELPPKNYPFPVPKGEAQLTAYFSLTDSKHLLIKFSMKVKS